MKKVLLAALAPLCFSFAAHAQIVYHDVNPDTTVDTWNSFSPCFMGVAHTAGSKYIDIWWHPTPEVVITPWNVEILYDAAGTYPAKLKLNDSITSSGQWKAVPYDPLNSAGTGNWNADATDKYLGFRFNDGTKMQYGWIKLTVAAGAASFTIKEWAHRPLKINAGQTTTTSVQYMISDRVEMTRQGRQVQFKGLTKGRSYQLAVAGMDGRLTKSVTIHSDDAVNIGDLAAGVYVLRLKGNDREAAFKIMIE